MRVGALLLNVLLCVLGMQMCTPVFAAAVVKNVQRGSTDLSVNPRTITITAVDPAKSYVIASFRTNSSDAAVQPTFEITNATTLTFTSFLQSADIKIEWEVVEFLSDVTVQRGLTTMPASNAANDNAPQLVNVAITSAPQNKSFVLVSQRYDDGRQNIDENWTPMASLTSATNLRLSRNEAAKPLIVAWQVVTFAATDPTTVQSGTTSITATNTTTTVNITAVDLTKSFLLLNRRASSSTGGVEGEYMVWGKFNSTTQLQFTRFANKNKVDISWFVVSLGPDSSVLSGDITMGSGVTTLNVPIPAVNTTQSMTYVSVAGGNPDVNRYDECVISNMLQPNGASLSFQRYEDNVTAYGVWFVVEFSFRAVYKETADLDGDGLIDAIRCLSFEPVNDAFAGMNVSVSGYTVTGFATGATANDNEFFILLQEQTLPIDTGDTNATPSVRILTNTTLTGITSGRLVRSESAALPAVDRAPPVLLACDWIDGSGGGVSATDSLILRMSEPVSVSGALIGELLLPVIGDTLDQSVIGTHVLTTNVFVNMLGTPLLSPGGVYVSSALLPGSPSGIAISDGTHFLDAANNTALNQTVATAVDIRPGESVVSIAWSDLTIVPRTWDIGDMLNSTSSDASQTMADFENMVVRNTGNRRNMILAGCSNSAPSNWLLSSTTGTDRFQMLINPSYPLGTFSIDLADPARPPVVNRLYSGLEHRFDIRMITPTDLSSGAGTQQTITVTITAMQD